MRGLSVEPTHRTIDTVSSILCEAVKNVLCASTKKPIEYSSTIQKIQKVMMKPDIGCFLQFSGDYNGLLVVNFSGNAAVSIYHNYMTSMGIPKRDLAKEFTSNEVIDSIGEIINQIMGEFMRMIDEKYQLVAVCGQPKVLALTSAITLTIDSDYRDNRRMAFNIEQVRFQLELALEQTEFINIQQGV